MLMNIITVSFLAALSFTSFGCKKTEGGAAVEAMKQYQSDLCACKDHDMECGKTASDVYMKMQSKIIDKGGDISPKSEPDVEKLQAEIADCNKRVMAPELGAAGAPPHGGAAPAAGSAGSSGQ
jgi:hypothetical protein